MDSKEYLIQQMKMCRRKMNIAKVIDYGILFAAAGGILGIICELASLIWRFYYVHLAAGLCFGVGLLAGIGYALYRRADMKQTAGRLDSFGLQERMITAYEQRDSEKEFALLQRQDALVHYNEIRGQIRISLRPDSRHILALILSVAVVAGLGLIPSPVRDQARLHHQVQEQAKEEQEELGELVDAREGVDTESLTEEQRALLQEMMDAMQLSREELAQADSWESLASATERLDYKYGQAAQSLASLASQLNDPGAVGIAGAEALAKAIANENGTQLASGTSSAGTGGENGNGESGNGDDSGQGDGGQEGQGDGSGQDGSGSNGQNNGSGQENGNSGNGSGQGSGNGNGQGQGNGNGNGQGQGNGNGNGQGQGNGGSGSGNGGNGRGTGSSDAAHDYVSIPNAIANDPSLTGNKNGDQDSDYFRQQNGLAWEGNHVDYNSVIGEYTDSAYEGIANGKYPSGMESVIRDYFENLNK